MSNYTIGRGETKTFTLTVTDEAGALVDLTGAQITFVVRNLAGDVVFTKRNTAAGGSDNEIGVLAQAGQTLGQFEVKIGSVDSDIEQTARWADCWVITAANEHLEVDEHAPFYVHGVGEP